MAIQRISKNNEIKKVLFFIEKDYFFTSMKCFLKLDDDIKSWKNHKKNLKLSKICKAIIDKSIGVGFNLNEILQIHVDRRKLKKL